MAIDLEIVDEPTQFWLGQIEGAQTECAEWYERGKAVNERYLDKKDAAPKSTQAHKMNTLWSNVQTIMPALYAKTPNPHVQRRFRDKDPVGKWAATTLERSLTYTLDAYDVDYAIRNCVQDYLLPGRGQVWVTYEPTFTAGPPGPDGKPTEVLAWEYCKTEHLNWKDFLHNPARTWDEVWWVGKRAYLSKDEVKAHAIIGKHADKLTYTDKKDEDKPAGDKAERVNKAAVWCIWSKTHKKVIYVSKNCPELLGEIDPPIQYEGFFPCPRPLTTTCTTDSIIPTPDFCQYQNQADEIDRLTQRINLLTDALRVVGVYDGALDGDNPGSALIAQVFANKGINEMIPVSTWAMFAQQGGFNGAVDFFPLDMVIKTLTECYAARDQAKQTMYEITGISDIVRGASDPDETARAQSIKSQWGSLRIRDRQGEVQRFVRDIMRLKSEIIAEHFQLETLKAMANCPIYTQQEKAQAQQRQQIAQQLQQAAQANPEMAQQIAQANPQLAQMAQPLSLDEQKRLQEPTWEEVYALLKDQKLRSFRIGIETDSTINADEVAEKQARVEFVTAATGFISAWGPIIAQAPHMAPLAGSLLMFATRAFKQSDSVESEIEAMVDTMSQQALLPQPPAPPDPKMEAERAKAEFEGKARQDEAGLTAEKHQFERDRMGHERGKMQMEAENMQQERAFKMQERQAQAQAQIETANAQRPSVEELTAIVGPVAQILQQMLAANAQAMQQIAETNAAVQQGVATAMAQLAQATQQMAEAASAPREIVVKRDQGGRINGGTATPRMN